MQYDKRSTIPGWWIHILLLLVIFLLTVSAGAGAEDGSPGLDEVQAPPEFNVGDGEVSEMVGRHFNDCGPVDFISEDRDRIVIGDLSYPVSPDASLSGIHEDDFVGIVLDRAGKVVEIKHVQRPD